MGRANHGPTRSRNFPTGILADVEINESPPAQRAAANPTGRRRGDDMRFVVRLGMQPALVCGRPEDIWR
jgi:hypothetical protein